MTIRSRLALPLSFAVVLLLPSSALAQGWTDLGGGDHEGADWAPANGTFIAGTHTNIGEFSVAAGTIVYVQPEENGTYGVLEIQACAVRVDGTLDGSSAGRPGGGPAPSNGGLQGQGPGAGCGGGPGQSVANGGSGGSYGGLGGPTDPNNGFGPACSVCDNPPEGHCDALLGSTYGTADGADIDMGSSGGAGGNSSGCNDSGGYGGRSGGAILLLGAGEISIAGSVLADGEHPPDDAAGCGYHPGGGGGAGGGVLLQAPSLVGSGLISARGGAGGNALGDGGDWGWAGGGGGGGRIKRFIVQDTFAGTVDASGGEGGTGAGVSGFNGVAAEDGTTNQSASAPLAVAASCGPAADAGGPYEVAEGGVVELVGTAVDPDGETLTYAWDFDGDGDFDDADSANPIFAAGDLDGPGATVVTLRATNESGDSGEAEATIDIANAAPAAPALVTPADDAEVPPGNVVFVFNRGVDASAADTVPTSILYVYADAELTDVVSEMPVDSDLDPFEVTVELQAGTYYWTATSTDDEDAVSETSTARLLTVAVPGGDGDADADADSDADADLDADSDGDGDGGNVDGCSCRAAGTPMGPAPVTLLLLMPVALVVARSRSRRRDSSPR